MMRLRIAWDDGVAGRCMASGAVAVHADHRAMVHSGMIADKGPMAG